MKSPGSFIKKLPWFRRWISAANGGVKTQYSAQMHSLHHTRFKEKTSLLFARLAKRVRARSSSMFVLDDFAPSSSSVLRTQQHLLRAGVKGSRICIANPGSLQCAASHKSGAVTICGKLEDALQGELKDKRSCAAYLDTCSGSAEYIADLIRACLRNANKRYVLAFTMLGRGPRCRGGANAAETSSVTARLSQLDYVLVQNGFSKIGKSDVDAVFAYSGGNMVITSFYHRS